MSDLIQSREFTESLPVAASPDEAQAHLRNLKIHTRRLQDLKDGRRVMVGNCNQAIKHEEGIIKALSDQDEGVVHRPIRVREEIDFSEGVLRCTRLDTGEVYMERSLTEDECQMSALPEEETPAPEKPRRGRPPGKSRKDVQTEDEAQPDPSPNLV